MKYKAGNLVRTISKKYYDNVICDKSYMFPSKDSKPYYNSIVKIDRVIGDLYLVNFFNSNNYHYLKDIWIVGEVKEFKILLKIMKNEI